MDQNRRLFVREPRLTLREAITINPRRPPGRQRRKMCERTPRSIASMGP
jgi:hypothetical protein